MSVCDALIPVFEHLESIRRNDLHVRNFALQNFAKILEIEISRQVLPATHSFVYEEQLSHTFIFRSQIGPKTGNAATPALAILRRLLPENVGRCRKRFYLPEPRTSRMAFRSRSAVKGLWMKAFAPHGSG